MGVGPDQKFKVQTIFLRYCKQDLWMYLLFLIQRFNQDFFQQEFPLKIIRYKIHLSWEDIMWLMINNQQSDFIHGIS